MLSSKDSRLHTFSWQPVFGRRPPLEFQRQSQHTGIVSFFWQVNFYYAILRCCRVASPLNQQQKLKRQRHPPRGYFSLISLEQFQFLSPQTFSCQSRIVHLPTHSGAERTQRPGTIVWETPLLLGFHQYLFILHEDLLGNASHVAAILLPPL